MRRNAAGGEGRRAPGAGMPEPSQSADLAYQERMLQGVSRTFALTIPQLPEPLAAAVGNAYLLCRIADVIEDEPLLGPGEKRFFSELFASVLAREVSPGDFVARLHPLLSHHTSDEARELIEGTARVARIVHSFPPRRQRTLQRCVRIMSRGMAEFQGGRTLSGLTAMADLDRYCYYVAGVVGEMLTELFCEHVPELRERRGSLLKLSVSFGQGLQMTNILKDVWEDRARGVCWLPRDVFERVGCDLDTLSPERPDPAFERGLRHLIGIASRHLADALTYTLMMPGHQAGIRRFCLRALGMAVLSLRKIRARSGYRAAEQVRISRSSVRATIVVTNLAVRRDALLEGLFVLLARPLRAAGEWPPAAPAPRGAGRA